MKKIIFSFLLLVTVANFCLGSTYLDLPIKEVTEKDKCDQESIDALKDKLCSMADKILASNWLVAVATCGGIKLLAPGICRILPEKVKRHILNGDHSVEHMKSCSLCKKAIDQICTE